MEEGAGEAAIGALLVERDQTAVSYDEQHTACFNISILCTCTSDHG